MADSLLVFAPHEQKHRAKRAFGILKRAGTMTPTGTNVKAVKIAMKPTLRLVQRLGLPRLERQRALLSAMTVEG